MLRHRFHRHHPQRRKDQRKASPGKESTDFRHHRRIGKADQQQADRLHAKAEHRHVQPAELVNGVGKQQPRANERAAE
ncbi:Uncharacterised protein [Klebsiella pneumoniae]|nr:Uncharacterised protein [Klebsiella pneumoniae]